ncbi:hypothetical protein EYF80_010596 [Liparis tanakae]|uniref:Uncharacterized protein n=1 Tax=Liparis tanakae TaxID=230148 RepID=A0A4Z2IN61_9TELE|nr:hypothetical protein EYF80_010596 [Liparis tanakae]
MWPREYAAFQSNSTPSSSTASRPVVPSLRCEALHGTPAFPVYFSAALTESRWPLHSIPPRCALGEKRRLVFSSGSCRAPFPTAAGKTSRGVSGR